MKRHYLSTFFTIAFVLAVGKSIYVTWFADSSEFEILNANLFALITLCIAYFYDAETDLSKLEDKMDLYNKNRMMDTELLRLYLQNRFTDVKNLIKK